MGDVSDMMAFAFRLHLFGALVFFGFGAACTYGVVKAFHLHPVERAKQWVCQPSPGAEGEG